MDFAQAMAFVEQFTRSGAPVRDLSRISGLMEKLGNPQDALQFVHIAGTNGKGSVAEYLTNILTASGCRTGTFTSPYIRHYRDRIRLNREDIPEEAVCAACEMLRQHTAPEDGYSQFEITFAIAMLYFLREKAEIVVLETGLGGLLDCTNIVRNTKVCVFTSIGLDHMAVLGNTVEEIAAQKAGIAKPGAALICSPDSGTALQRILSGFARKTGGEPPEILDLADESVFRELECDAVHTMFDYHGIVYRTGMGGRHQICNAVTAIAAARALAPEFPVTTETIQQGLEQTHLPGRMQILSEHPRILLDGAHNRDGIRRLAETLRDEKIAPAVGLIGMTHSDASDFAAQTLGACFSRVLCVDGFAANAMPASALAEQFAAAGCRAEAAPLSDALKIAKSWAQSRNGTVVICGSLFLASRYLQQEE